MNIKDFLQKLFHKYKTGYFICELDSLTSYVFNDYRTKNITIFYASSDLSVSELKYLFEREGRTVTLQSDSDNNQILEKASLDSTEENEVTSEEVYLVKDGQLKPMTNLMLKLEQDGIMFQINKTPEFPSIKRKPISNK